MLLLTIVTNKSNSFETELILNWKKINQFRFLRQFFFRNFSGFNIGCPSDAVLFKLAELFAATRIS